MSAGYFERGEGRGFRGEFREVLDRATEFLGSSADNIIRLREGVSSRLRELYDELDSVRAEINGMMTAYDVVCDSYREARHNLAEAEAANDHAAQARYYREAESCMKMRATFDAREKELRGRRDDMDRERSKLERVLSESNAALSRLRLAADVLSGRDGTLGAFGGADDARSVVLGIKFAENENKRIAREIHDGPVQQFAASLLMIEYLERVMARGDGEAAKDELARVKREMNEALADLRGFLMRLRPPGLDKGLGEALNKLAESYRERRGVDFIVSFRGGSPGEAALSGAMSSNLFRVAQEAASNALRHGGATRIAVDCSIEPPHVKMEIADNGSGFDVGRGKALASERGSYGLANMSDRINFMNGTLKIESAPGSGTRISVSVPLGGDSDGKQEAD